MCKTGGIFTHVLGIREFCLIYANRTTFCGGNKTLIVAFGGAISVRIILPWAGMNRDAIWQLASRRRTEFYDGVFLYPAVLPAEGGRRRRYRSSRHCVPPKFSGVLSFNRDRQICIRADSRVLSAKDPVEANEFIRSRVFLFIL